MDPDRLVRPGAGTVGQLLVSTADPAVVPNAGLRMNVTAYTSAPLPSGSSFQVGAEEQIGGYEAVFGLFENDVLAPVPFFEVFRLSNDSSVHLAYWKMYPVVAGQSYEFLLALQQGTTWALALNGAQFALNPVDATFDFGASASTDATNLSFAETAISSGGATTPARIDVPLAFAVLSSSGWYLPHSAVTVFNGAAGARWGVEGRIQHPSLAPGELQSGSGVANLTNGTSLWTGGVIPIALQLGTNSTAGLGLSLAPLFLSTRYLGGAPTPFVSLFLQDSLGGGVVPPSVVTGATGLANATFLLPNVSERSSDALRVVVTTFGYSGSASLTFTVDPAVQVVLSVAPENPTVALAGAMVLTVSAHDRNGSVLAGLALRLTATGGAVLDAAEGVTDAQGALSVHLVAPSIQSTIDFNASVLSPGYWGSTSVPVGVGVTPTPFYIEFGAYVIVGVLVALAVLLGVVAYWRWRRGRQPIPHLPIRRYLVESRTTPPSTEAPSAPPAGDDVTRTPP